MEKKYFEGLDVIRAIAALLVVIHHIELTAHREFGKVAELGIIHNAVVYLIGKRGVHIFFMLSGFLITFLLIQEKLKRGKIDIGRFYLRRILRIWPLYFLTVFIGFFVLPFLLRHWEFLNALHYYPSLIQSLGMGNDSPIKFFMFFIPNLAMQFYPAVAGASHLWSIGVEEQFYLFWPLIFLIRNTRVQVLFIVIVALLPFLPYFMVRVPGLTPWADWVKHFPFFWMAFGGIGAFVFHYYQQQLSTVFLRLSWASWLFMLLFLITSLMFKINDYLFGLMGLIMIFRFSIGNQWLASKFPLLPFLGKISVGLYIYHPAVMFIVIAAFQFYFPFWNENVALKLLVYFSVILFTVIIAWASYNFFEKPFIQLKDNKFRSI
jgi:peptidoglycan/LPS O-acetylase OafA/YrhL